MKRKIVLFLAFGSLALGAVNVFAQEAGSSTSASYEENLRRWQSMTEEERQVLREKVRGMNVQQREELRKNAQKFRGLPESDQTRMRENFKRFRQLPKEKKEVIRNRGRRFHNLSSEKKRELRQGIRGNRGERKRLEIQQKHKESLQGKQKDRPEKINGSGKDLRRNQQKKSILNNQKERKPLRSKGLRNGHKSDGEKMKRGGAIREKRSQGHKRSFRGKRRGGRKK